MKTFKQYIEINEWKFNKDSDISQIPIYKYAPESWDDLVDIIIEKLKENNKKPYLNDIDISNVLELDSLFYYRFDKYISKGINTRDIEIIDISLWDLTNVVRMQGMFESLINLKEVYFPKNSKPLNLRSAHEMFRNCESLSIIQNIDCLDISNVKKLNKMFNNCESLKSLDLSSFNMANVKDISSMFEGCKNLETIIVNPNMKNLMDNLLSFNINNVFSNCPAKIVCKKN